ncbi:MAG: nuclear transport factor 2 family protein [Hyphomicrobium aestuarii]|nr:nuclear transport factor 2 family protein [Hyphomicrobium aestuarii]
MDATSVISEFNLAYQTGDIDRAFGFVAEDCIFTMHFAEDLVQHAGRWQGASQIRQAIDMARSNYQYLVYQPVITMVDDDTVRVRVDFIGWHRASGEQISMTFTQMFVVHNGKLSAATNITTEASLKRSSA